MRLILASASAARRDLLRRAGIPFETSPSKVRERRRGASLRELVLDNAMRKARAAARRHPGRWILAADTLIEYAGRIYGKPSSRKAAVETLSKLAGRPHVLATGVVLMRGRRVLRTVVRSKVRVRRLDAAAIRRILGRQDPTRFAGGYSIAEKRDPLIERIEGSFTNVVGLPMEWLRRRLKNLKLVARSL
ncbi:MAG: septum formation protein Maf [Planctomycetes bacterium]|nr:septum formation protein Maf [Planctomycetota bacterium]